MLYPPFNIVAVQGGLKEIAYAGDFVQFPMNGYGTADKKIAQNPGQVKAVIRAILKGVNYGQPKLRGGIAHEGLEPQS
jgi:ABC-type nitrate/sulfonate/bicarbonate transport system substrate-binding protein